MRSEGVEPPPPCEDQGLSLACLPKFHHERVSGVSGSRTPRTQLARQGCTPVPTPRSQRPGSNRLPPPYESGAPPVVLRWHTSRRRESNPQQSPYKGDAPPWLAGMVSEAGVEPARPSRGTGTSSRRVYLFRHKDIELGAEDSDRGPR